MAKAPGVSGSKEGLPTTSTDGTDGNDNSGRENLIIGSNRADTLVGGGGRDVIFGFLGNDFLEGKGGPDLAYGGDGNDRLVMGGGPDVGFGGNGRDTLEGGGGPDQLFGDNGNDIIIGGAARDKLSGGQGRDVFVYTAVGDAPGGNSGDEHTTTMAARGPGHEGGGCGGENSPPVETIIDFTDGKDKIYLSHLGSGSFSFLGTADGFTGTNQILVRQVQRDTLVQIRVAAGDDHGGGCADGDCGCNELPGTLAADGGGEGGGSTMAILLLGVHANLISASDFLFA